MFKKTAKQLLLKLVQKRIFVVSYWEMAGRKGVSFVPHSISEWQNALGQDCHQA